MSARFVLDATVTLSWCYEDERDDVSLVAMDCLLDGEALAPIIWPLEVANALLVGERRGRLTPDETAEFLSYLAVLPIRVDGSTPSRFDPALLALAREHGLSSYDASYLALALREQLPLATKDVRLLSAMAACGVPPLS